MKADLTGTVMEKYTREHNKDGQNFERMYLRLYQPGERVNVDVLVKTDTYMQVEEGQKIKIEDCTITTFNNYLYAKQN
jgi:hypothetical protein